MSGTSGCGAGGLAHVRLDRAGVGDAAAGSGPSNGADSVANAATVAITAPPRRHRRRPAAESIVDATMAYQMLDRNRASMVAAGRSLVGCLGGRTVGAAA